MHIFHYSYNTRNILRDLARYRLINESNIIIVHTIRRISPVELNAIRRRGRRQERTFFIYRPEFIILLLLSYYNTREVFEISLLKFLPVWRRLATLT